MDGIFPLLRNSVLRTCCCNLSIQRIFRMASACILHIARAQALSLPSLVHISFFFPAILILHYFYVLDTKVRDMEMEARNAPPSFRARMASRIKGYQSDVQKHQRDLRTARQSGGRDELLGGDSWESKGDNQRARLLDSQDTLDRTSSRITNTQRIADETEQIGAGVLTELGTQRDTIIRTAHKVQGVDSNLGKSKRILNSMSRR